MLRDRLPLNTNGGTIYKTTCIAAAATTMILLLFVIQTQTACAMRINTLREEKRIVNRNEFLLPFMHPCVHLVCYWVRKFLLRWRRF